MDGLMVGWMGENATWLRVHKPWKSTGNYADNRQGSCTSAPDQNIFNLQNNAFLSKHPILKFYLSV
jgi:hypothetical protein